jgi:methionyl-tRNA formyltransferase
VFFGSSEFSVPALKRILAEHDVVAVCSRPDKPAGRGQKLTPTPVTRIAREAGYNVMTPQRLDAEFVAALAKLRPQLLACASYGKILPPTLLKLEGMAALNVHPSLLPLYRGATPMQTALREGARQTGVTTFWMTDRMDAGDIALAHVVEIEDEANYGWLHDKLAALSAELLSEAAALLVQGNLPRYPQREEHATYTKPLTKDDLRLRLDVAARSAVNQIRSLSPKPGAWMLLSGKRLKVLEAAVVTPQVSSAQAPGELVSMDSRGPVIATSPGAIQLRQVIPEGKPSMTGAEFAQRTIAVH